MFGQTHCTNAKTKMIFLKFYLDIITCDPSYIKCNASNQIIILKRLGDAESLDRAQVGHFVGPDLGPNCLAL